MFKALRWSMTLVAICSLNTLLVLVLVADRHAAHGTGNPIGNGDVDGDRSINIADAVYLLQHLFSGGPPPVAIAASGLSQEEAEILSHMSIEHLPDGQGGTNKTIRFTGVNVQLVNGLGATNGYPQDPYSQHDLEIQVNGLGNLLVGYQEAPLHGPAERTGSHNIVAGNRQNYTSYAGVLAGRENEIHEQFCFVFGVESEASGIGAGVFGGNTNVSSGTFSVAIGGADNEATQIHSAAIGGRFNDVYASGAVIVGGMRSDATGSGSAVFGGEDNVATASCSVVCGGFENEANGDHATLLGGFNNQAPGDFAAVCGGRFNTASGSYAAVVGGFSNCATNTSATVTGGTNNEASGTSASVSGGATRVAAGLQDWVAGGLFQDN